MAKKRSPGAVDTATVTSAISAAVEVYSLAVMGTVAEQSDAKPLSMLSGACHEVMDDPDSQMTQCGDMLLMLLVAASRHNYTVTAVLNAALTRAAALTEDAAAAAAKRESLDAERAAERAAS